MVDTTQQDRPETQLEYVLRTGNVLFYRRRQELSVRSGVPKSTLNKIMDGTRGGSRSTTVQAIHDVLKQEEQKVAEEKAVERKASEKQRPQTGT